MEQIFLVLIGFVVFFLILSKSTDLLIDSLVKIAKKFHVSEFAVGFFILGVATSMPELFVGINAGFNNEVALSVGNIIGGAIVLLTLAIGISAVLNKGINIQESLTTKELALNSFVILLPALLIVDGQFTRLDGFIMISVYILYVFLLNKRESLLQSVKDAILNHDNKFLRSITIFIIGLLGLLIASKGIVELSNYISVFLGIPLIIVGFVILAVGTNIPEISIAIKSSRSNHKDVGLGDFVGSAAANTMVLGIITLLFPVRVENISSVALAVVFLIITILVFAGFIYRKGAITRFEGFALILIYLMFLAGEIYTKFI